MTVENVIQIHPKKIFADDIFTQSRVFLVQIGHRLDIDLYGFYLSSLGHKILREHAHTRSDFQNGDSGASINGVCNAASYVLVDQKMLTEILLGLDWFHRIVLFFRAKVVRFGERTKESTKKRTILKHCLSTVRLFIFNEREVVYDFRSFDFTFCYPVNSIYKPSRLTSDRGRSSCWEPMLRPKLLLQLLRFQILP